MIVLLIRENTNLNLIKNIYIYIYIYIIIIYILKKIFQYIKLFIKINFKFMSFTIKKGDWGLGIGDWGLGIGPNPQSPIPNPQSPKEHPNFNENLFYFYIFLFKTNCHAQTVVLILKKFLSKLNFYSKPSMD